MWGELNRMGKYLNFILVNFTSRGVASSYDFQLLIADDSNQYVF